MTTENNQGSHTSGGEKAVQAVQAVDQVTNVIGSLVPTVAAIGGAIRLIMTAVRPSDAKKAQAFDAASADLKNALGDLKSAIDGFEQAKAAAAAHQGSTTSASGASASLGAGSTTTTHGSSISDPAGG